MWETWVWSLGWEDPLEKDMASHSSILAWRIPWTEEPGGLQSTGLQRVRHDWATSLQVCHGFPYKEQASNLTTAVTIHSDFGAQENKIYRWFHFFPFSSVQFSCSVVSDSLRPHVSQHARPPCPSPTPGVHPNSCASSQWCHPAISSSVVPFSSCPQSLPASESFPMSQLVVWGGQSIGVLASASVLPINTQDWSPLEWTGWTLYVSINNKWNVFWECNLRVDNMCFKVVSLILVIQVLINVSVITELVENNFHCSW